LSGTEQGIQQRLAEFVGVDASKAPTLRLLSPGEEMRKFVYSGDLEKLTVDAVKTFIEDFKADKLNAHLKSEVEPTEQGPLTVLVGTSFNRVVMDTTKDVLVKFYAPWCGHCKTMAPAWEELANQVADIPDLVIAKLDATANEVAGLQIQGFPTIKFYPKDNKNGMAYEGDRDLKSFQNYLSEHSAAYRNGATKSGGQAYDEL
jgi:protein disulfide-isomerase A1